MSSFLQSRRRTQVIVFRVLPAHRIPRILQPEKNTPISPKVLVSNLKTLRIKPPSFATRHVASLTRNRSPKLIVPGYGGHYRPHRSAGIPDSILSTSRIPHLPSSIASHFLPSARPSPSVGLPGTYRMSSLPLYLSTYSRTHFCFPVIGHYEKHGPEILTSRGPLASSWWIQTEPGGFDSAI